MGAAATSLKHPWFEGGLYLPRVTCPPHRAQSSSRSIKLQSLRPLVWCLMLPHGTKHLITIKIGNARFSYSFNSQSVFVFDAKPFPNTWLIFMTVSRMTKRSTCTFINYTFSVWLNSFFIVGLSTKNWQCDEHLHSTLKQHSARPVP